MASLQLSACFVGIAVLAVPPIPCVAQDPIEGEQTPEARQTPASGPPKIEQDQLQQETQEKPDKRIFWIIPNYRTSPSLTNYVPITSAQKFKLAARDSLDFGGGILAVIFGGFGQLDNSNPSFGQGASGYGKYVAASYVDFTVGNFMAGGVYTSLLHQDPRFFRRGTGTGWSRVRYAASQIFVTHGDSGRLQFNYSEIAGNATSVAVSNLYYRDTRTAADNAMKFGVQLGVDMAGNILKEFWPDLNRKLFRHGKTKAGISTGTSDLPPALLTNAG